MFNADGKNSPWVAFDVSLVLACGHGRRGQSEASPASRGLLATGGPAAVFQRDLTAHPLEKGVCPPKEC